MKEPFSEQPQPSNKIQENRSNHQGHESSENLGLDNSKKDFWVELFGASVLVVGMVAYAIYRFWTEPALPPIGSQPIQPVSPNPLASLPASPQKSPTRPTSSKPDRSQQIYQRAPSSGVYYAESAVYANSRREVLSRNGRFCIRLVDGPKTQTSGYQQEVVSSLSFRTNGIFIDASNDQLKLDNSSTEMRDRVGLWQLLEAKVSPTPEMEECLTKTGKYVKQMQGEFIGGV